MLEQILLTLRETWDGYVEALRLVIPRLLAMLSVVAAGSPRRARARRHRPDPGRLARGAPRGADGVGSGPFVRRLLEERLARRARTESDGSSHL
jgi:hypothetical protein